MRSDLPFSVERERRRCYKSARTIPALGGFGWCLGIDSYSTPIGSTSIMFPLFCPVFRYPGGTKGSTKNDV